MRTLLLALAVAFLAACPARRPPEGPAPPPDPPDETEQTMTPDKQVDFVAGPAIAPAQELLAWLEGTIQPLDPRRRIRLPVIARWEDEHRLGFGDVFVGLTEASADGALLLAPDDGGLSVSLIDTLAGQCPEGAAACAMWLEGYWGELMEMPGFDMPGLEPEGPKRHAFAVLKVVGPIADGDPATALVEAPAP
jgi:hypothetical protein